MFAPPRRAPSKPKIETISNRDWLKGTVTAFDNGRTPIDGLRASGNVILEQDGTIRPRPSLKRYGTQPTGTLLGDLFEFSKTTAGVTENYIIGMFNVSGTAKPYYAKDGGAWTVANGKSYDTTARAHFCQVDNKVLITNGVDYLSYLDLPTLAVIPFVALSTPSAPSIVRTGMVGTTFTYYYKVTANSTVGETAASANTSQQTSLQREAWDSATNFLTISWSAVTSARSYNVYMGTVSGEEILIAAGVNGLSFKDDGSTAPDVTRSAPLFDTTAGPKVTRATVINGQVFLTGDADNRDYVRIGGSGTDILDFSPFGGGGWASIGKGTKEVPVRVLPYRDGRGNPVVTVLCRGTNGSGKRFIMTPTSTTVGETVINYWDIAEDNGQDGTDSPDATFIYRDDVYYPSRNGFKKTGTKPQLQNILSTSTISETILEDVKNLNSAYMDKAVGLGFQERLYFALPVGSTTNNEIWVLDLQRGGAWMKPWNISASTMCLYNDNSGSTHHLVVSNNVVYELTYAQATLDDSTSFRTNATSGFIKFSENGLEWAKIVDITFVLLRPQGTISFTVSGKTEEGQLESVGGDSFTSTASIAGWGEASWGGAPDKIFGWSNFETVPTMYGDDARFITIEPEDEDEVQWLTWELNTSGSGVDYQLADVIIRFVRIGVKDLT
jgi:hypothetical protein